MLALTPSAWWRGTLIGALIAYVLWPIFIPLAGYRIETDKKRRRVILICQAIGLGAGITYLVSIIRNPVDVSVNACSLSYHIDAPSHLFAPYLIAVSVPFLVSTRRGLVSFGLAMLIACGTAFYFASRPSFPSVWCFFAAALSFSLYFFFRAAVPEEAPQAEQAYAQHR